MSEIIVSIIVPTYREAANIRPLADRIDKAMTKHPYEIVIIDDDSKDGIEDIANDLDPHYNLKIHVRKNERGLSSAVIEGFGRSQGQVIVVMDADLSHPPEKLPEMVEPIIKGQADFVIGSRFIKGGSAPHFNLFRKLNAWVSKTMARPFTRVNDPMAGFFAFPRTLIQKDHLKLNPLGFKIGLELIVKASPASIIEVPIQFQERLHGESKLNLKEQINYLLHLRRLFEYKYQALTEFIRFSIIGSLGMIIDLSCVFITYGLISIPFRIARALSFIFALTFNFFMNRRFNFSNARGGNLFKQYLTFFIVCLFGFAINWSITVYLFENTFFFNTHYLFSAFIGIIGGLMVNFLGSKFLAFKANTRIISKHISKDLR
jgi:dolichol-phosphate mannosyltransferase